MNIQERKSRIIARGEHSGHCHVIVGDASVREEKGETYIKVGDKGASIRHLLEKAWEQGQEIWTKEHEDISLEPGEYKYVPQLEFDPYNAIIQQVKD